MKKRFYKILSFFFIWALLFTSCGYETASSNIFVDNVTTIFNDFASNDDAAKYYAFIACKTKKQADKFYLRQVEGFVDTIEDAGYIAEIYYPDEVTAEAQAALMEDLAMKGIDGICVDPVAGADFSQAEKRAREVGAMIVYGDFQLDSASTANTLYPYDVRNTAYKLVELMWQQMDGQGQFALTLDDMDRGSQRQVLSLIKAFLKARDKYKNMELVDVCYLESQQEAYDQKAGELLQNHPDLKLICSLTADGTLYLAKGLKATTGSAKAVGIASPADLAEYMGSDIFSTCSGIVSWKAKTYGKELAYYLLDGGGDSQSLEIPYTYDASNISSWKQYY